MKTVTFATKTGEVASITLSGRGVSGFGDVKRVTGIVGRGKAEKTMKVGHANREDVLFLPDWRGTNPYLDLLATGIEGQGTRVLFSDFSQGGFPLFRAFRAHSSVRTLHLHWADDLIAPLCWKTGPVKHALHTLALMLDVYLVRAFGGRIVWTVHNLYRHESKNLYEERRALRLLFRLVNRAVAHSDGARKQIVDSYGISDSEKLDVIPHGNYMSSYSDDAERAKTLCHELGADCFDRVFLFFGALRQYKGLMDLIHAFCKLDSQDVCLIIAGAPDTSETEARIRELAAADDRIILHLGFTPDNDVAPLFSIADVVVLPFQRILTSGSAILAMSMGKALVLPEDARILGGADDRGVQFYGDGALQEALELILCCDTAEMGQVNLERVRRNTWPEIGRAYTVLYSDAG